MFYGPGFNPNTGFGNSFWAEEAGDETKSEANYQERGPENAGG